MTLEFTGYLAHTLADLGFVAGTHDIEETGSYDALIRTYRHPLGIQVEVNEDNGDVVVTDWGITPDYEYGGYDTRIEFKARVVPVRERLVKMTVAEMIAENERIARAEQSHCTAYAAV